MQMERKMQMVAVNTRRPLLLDIFKLGSNIFCDVV